jgi:hypothetical protein
VTKSGIPVRVLSTFAVENGGQLGARFQPIASTRAESRGLWASSTVFTELWISRVIHRCVSWRRGTSVRRGRVSRETSGRAATSREPVEAGGRDRPTTPRTHPFLGGIVERICPARAFTTRLPGRGREAPHVSHVRCLEPPRHDPTVATPHSRAHVRRAAQPGVSRETSPPDPDDTNAYAGRLDCPLYIRETCVFLGAWRCRNRVSPAADRAFHVKHRRMAVHPVPADVPHASPLPQKGTRPRHHLPAHCR